MPWFWDLVSSIGSDPFQAPSTKDLVTQPFDGLLHWNLRNLNLHAWLLEPLPFRSKGSPTKWQQELRLLKDAQPEPFINQSWPFLPTALKGCRGIVFTHGVRMGGRAAGNSLSRLYLRNRKV